MPQGVPSASEQRDPCFLLDSYTDIFFASQTADKEVQDVADTNISSSDQRCEPVVDLVTGPANLMAL